MGGVRDEVLHVESRPGSEWVGRPTQAAALAKPAQREMPIGLNTTINKASAFFLDWCELAPCLLRSGRLVYALHPGERRTAAAAHHHALWFMAAAPSCDVLRRLRCGIDRTRQKRICTATRGRRRAGRCAFTGTVARRVRHVYGLPGHTWLAAFDREMLGGLVGLEPVRTIYNENDSHCLSDENCVARSDHGTRVMPDDGAERAKQWAN